MTALGPSRLLEGWHDEDWQDDFDEWMGSWLDEDWPGEDVRARREEDRRLRADGFRVQYNESPLARALHEVYDGHLAALLRPRPMLGTIEP